LRDQWQGRPDVRGRARVFDGEEATLQAILDAPSWPATCWIVRYEGPRGGPGMREMLSPTAASWARASVTGGIDHRRRFSGGSHGFVVGHVSPKRRRVVRWPWVRDGDRIGMMQRSARSRCMLQEAELARRRKSVGTAGADATHGVLAKYAALVSSAFARAVTDRGLEFSGQ